MTIFDRLRRNRKLFYHWAYDMWGYVGNELKIEAERMKVLIQMNPEAIRAESPGIGDYMAMVAQLESSSEKRQKFAQSAANSIEANPGTSHLVWFASQTLPVLGSIALVGAVVVMLTAV